MMDILHHSERRNKRKKRNWKKENCVKSSCIEWWKRCRWEKDGGKKKIVSLPVFLWLTTIRWNRRNPNTITTTSASHRITGSFTWMVSIRTIIGLSITRLSITRLSITGLSITGLSIRTWSIPSNGMVLMLVRDHSTLLSVATSTSWIVWVVGWWITIGTDLSPIHGVVLSINVHLIVSRTLPCLFLPLVNDVRWQVGLIWCTAVSNEIRCTGSEQVERSGKLEGKFKAQSQSIKTCVQKISLKTWVSKHPETCASIWYCQNLCLRTKVHQNLSLTIKVSKLES